jgi:hypothetical protein
MVLVHVTEPPGPIAVSRYMVVDCGMTEVEPESATVPRVVSVADVALDVFQNIFVD